MLTQVIAQITSLDALFFLTQEKWELKNLNGHFKHLGLKCSKKGDEKLTYGLF